MAFPADLTCFLSSVIFWLLDFFGVGVFVFLLGESRKTMSWVDGFVCQFGFGAFFAWF